MKSIKNISKPIAIYLKFAFIALAFLMWKFVFRINFFGNALIIIGITFPLIAFFFAEVVLLAKHLKTKMNLE